MKLKSALLLLTTLLTAAGMLAAQTPAETIVDFYADIPFERLEDGGFVLGDPDAPVTIIQFGDFACPHCQRYFSTVKQFMESFVATGQARFEYRLFVSGVDPVYGPYTARLAECADELQPGAFWLAHDALYDFGTRLGFNEITGLKLAYWLGLDEDELLDCVESATETAQWEIDQEFGRSLDVIGTPAIMIRVGEDAPTFITFEDEAFTSGGVPFEVLEAVVISYQEEA
jgi:protein-disulfide isomerase